MGRFFCFYTKLSQSPANARKFNIAEQQRATKSNKTLFTHQVSNGGA
jgi:hypothetical protein